MNVLHIFREWESAYQLVGSLVFSQGELRFTYADSYLSSAAARPISLSLPLQDATFFSNEAAPFFSGLAPEGDMKRLLAESIHSSSFAVMLRRLNNESIGGLIFNTEPEVKDEHASYRPLEELDLIRLRDEPRTTAFEMSMSSRLSLSGAQSKAGLYCAESTAGRTWYLPDSTAPSTHIVKTPQKVFPDQTLNEALCLETARRCGFDTADWELLNLDGGEPLLAVRRFDRTFPDDPDKHISGLPAPRRLHQEDFCQASLLMPEMKYEPTGGNYASRCGTILTRASSNPFGDRAFFLQALYFDYLIGNCDNHLKNHAMLWDETWSTCELAPLYDITCTTIYPSVEAEMGVSLCPSRKIFDVTPHDIVRTSQALGVPQKLGESLYKELHANFPKALDAAANHLAQLGYNRTERLVEHIRKEFSGKVQL